MQTKILPSSIQKNLQLPIIAAPMFLVSGPELVISCCENGIVGSFPFQNARTIEQLEEWLETITTRLSTSRDAVWAANLVVHRSYDRMESELALVKKFKPPIVITALGNPSRVLDAVHEYGGLVFADVNSVHFAKKAAATGVDGLVLVSSGAGGHTGQMNSFAFVESVRTFWDGYLALAGGMSTGYSVAACEMLGVNFAYLGSAFLVAEESLANPEYKDMVLRSTFDDIICTDAFTGVHANMLRGSITKAGYDPTQLKKKDQINFEQPLDGGKAWKNIWSAGHGVENIQNIQPVSAIVEKLKNEYQAARMDRREKQLIINKGGSSNDN